MQETSALNHRDSDVTAAQTVWDHPLLGGRITVCVLLYGRQHFALHRRCIESICATVPPSRMDLRIGCNDVGPDTERLLKALPVTKLYADGGNLLKYRRMRQMLHDQAEPIRTPWVLWLDDDSHMIHDFWLSALGQTIVQTPPEQNVACYGIKALHPLVTIAGRDPRDWFKASPCYRGRPFQKWRRGGEAGGVDCIFFPVGGCWCVSVAALRAANLPEPRVVHWGGDIAIGFALYQAGYRIGIWNERRQFCVTSDAPPRGESVFANSIRKLGMLPWFEHRSTELRESTE